MDERGYEAWNVLPLERSQRTAITSLAKANATWLFVAKRKCTRVGLQKGNAHSIIPPHNNSLGLERNQA